MILINPNTLFIGRKVHYLDECDSTNSYAHELINKNHSIEGETIVCGHQLHGKGQKGNICNSYIQTGHHMYNATM